MKPRIAFINGSGNGSTGRICYFLARFGENNGRETNRFFSFACPPGQSQDGVPFQLVEESSIQYFANRVLCRANGSDGLHNKGATKRLLKQLHAFRPDVVHVHNIHGHYLNLKLLFSI